jgi:hypothetical protein
MKTYQAAMLATVLFASYACATRGSTVEEAAASINEADYMRKLGIIAADSMMGRDTPSPGLELTAAWIANEFRRYDLEPGGDGGTYLQRWPYPSFSQDWDATTVHVEGGPTLVLGEDMAYDGPPTDQERTGDLVVLSGQADNAFAAPDLAGRYVLIFPDAIQGNGWTGALRGVSGVFVVSDLEDEAWEAYVAESRGTAFRVYGERPEFRGTPRFQIRRAAARAILDAVGLAEPQGNGPLAAQVVPGITVRVSGVTLQVDDAAPPNVVGILPGRDPELRDQYVVFSAHMDHVGVNAARARQDSVFDESGSFIGMETDSIFNGADDDGSGTIAVVEVAQAFSMLSEPPRRSMIFLLVSGEEKGLLGSGYFASNAPVPLGDVVANFNTDMIGRNWSDTVVVIGKEHSELGEIMNRIGAEHPELDMAPIDDRWPGESFYTRSDHFNFARRGVPVLFFFTGVHDDYHQATDEIRKIDGGKSARIARLVFFLGNEVANMDEPPLWYDDSYDQFVSDPPDGALRRSRPR